MFLVAAALCVVGSPQPAASGLEFLRIASGFLMFFMIDRILEQTNNPKPILGAVYASAVIPVFLALVGSHIGIHLTESKDRISRITSTFSQASPFSYYLVVLTLMALGLALYAGRKWRLPLLAAAGLLSITLILTFTRTAWIAMVAGAIVLGAYAGKKVLLVMVTVVVLAVLFVPAISARFQELGSDNTYTYNYRQNSLEWRLSYWSDIIPLANSNPVTGIGLKMTPVLGGGKLPHNDYLRSYIEIGLVGLVAFITVQAAMILTPLRGLRQATDPLQRGLMLGFLAGAVALAVASLADNILDQVVVLWYVFAFAGCATWAARRAAQSRATSAPVLVAAPASEADRFVPER